MATKPNLVDRIGLVIPHWPLEPIIWWLIAGMRHFRMGIEWAEVRYENGKYSFEVYKPALKLIQRYNGKVLIHFFAVPQRLAPDYPRIPRLIMDAIPIMLEEWKPDFKEYLRQLLAWLTANDFDSTVKVMGPIVETNLNGWWQDAEAEELPEKEKEQRRADDFARLVIEPSSEMLRAGGKAVIAGTVTLQGERKQTFDRAINYFRIYKSQYSNLFDHIDIHIYRDKGKDFASDIKKVFAYFDERDKPIKKLWISECSVKETSPFSKWEQFWRKLSGKSYSGEQNQERNLKDFLEFYTSEKPKDKAILDRIERIYLFKCFDAGPGTDGLLTDDFTPKRAAFLLREYLQ